MKASIIIPVCNSGRHLRECLDSALSQTLRDIEIICVDDGSTDGSPGILREYAARDSRVRAVFQPNAGAGAARNAGMELSRGEYLAFLDADDLYPDPEVLADLAGAAAARNAAACGGSLEELLPNGAIRSTFSGCAGALSFGREEMVDFRDYAYDYGFYRFVYSRKLLVDAGIKFPGYRRFQDPPFMVRALAAAGVFCALPRVSYRYRVELRPVAWRADGMRLAKDLLRGLADVATLSKELALPKLARTLLCHACEQYGEVLLDAGIARQCRGEIASLCRALDVPDAAALLRLPYPGRTPVFYRRAKIAFRRRFGPAFKTCRFAADAARYGLPYAVGRFKGKS